MKKFPKRALALLLSIILVFTAVPVSSFASAEKPVPLVYVGGQGCSLSVDEPDGSTRQIYPISLPENFAQTVVEENIDVFAKAVVTQQWDEFCDVLYNIITELYKDTKLDENGEASNGSRADWNWKQHGLYGQRLTGNYASLKYDFQYDWRVDPYETAEILHDYIEYVLSVTGAEKVALSGRCLGACIVSAYMEKYDGEYVSDLILYASALKGATQVSKAFCGELYLDSDGVERFIYDNEFFPEEGVDELIRSFITLFNDTLGLDIACWSVNNVYPDIYMNIIPRVLIDTFGTFPGFWSMVSDEDYQKAKDTVFYGADTEKYAGLISKIDNYHYNVQCKAEENFTSYAEKGIEISNVVKYGYQTIPVTEDGDILSDDICDVHSASMGAATSKVACEFNWKYLKNASQSGTGMYISPDRQIDASTCFMPETTWFIKNLEHKDFPDIIDGLFNEIINNDNYTVNSDENYPQFLVYNKTEEGVETLLPMTDENKNTDDKYKVSFFKALGNLLRSLFKILRNHITEEIAEKKSQEV